MIRLSRRIREADLTPEAARTFSDCLRAVARADGTVHDDESALINRLVADLAMNAESAAPMDAMWPHAELLLTASLYVAVADGNYGVEEARAISDFAHRLGFSAHQLGQLEAKVFAELKERAARKERPT